MQLYNQECDHLWINYMYMYFMRRNIFAVSMKRLITTNTNWLRMIVSTITKNMGIPHFSLVFSSIFSLLFSWKFHIVRHGYFSYTEHVIHGNFNITVIKHTYFIINMKRDSYFPYRGNLSSNTNNLNDLYASNSIRSTFALFIFLLI